MSEIYADSIEAKVDGTNQIVPIRDITKAPAIIASASGESIELSDSGDAPLTDIKLYGKSKQDGEPSPDNPVEIEIPGSDGNVEIEVTGANLYDLDSVGTYYDNFQSLNAKNGQSLYIMIETTSGTSQMNYRFSFVDGTKGGDESIVSPSESNGVNKKVITLNKDITGICFYNVTIDNIRTVSKIMVAISDTELTYEPYKHTSATLPTPNGLPGIPVTSGGNYTDADGQQWVCDEIDFKRGKYVQRVEKVVFTGNETWDTALPSSGSRYFVYTGIEVYSLPTNNNTRAYSNYFKNIGFYEGDAGGTGVTAVNNRIRIYIGTEMSQTITNVTQWNEHLSQKNTEGNPVYVWYQLQTPIETDLTTEQLTALKQLRTYQTVTNITTDSEPQVGMEVEYTADTKTCIDNAIKEVVRQAATLAKV